MNFLAFAFNVLINVLSALEMETNVKRAVELIGLHCRLVSALKGFMTMALVKIVNHAISGAKLAKTKVRIARAV